MISLLSSLFIKSDWLSPTSCDFLGTCFSKTSEKASVNLEYEFYLLEYVTLFGDKFVNVDLNTVINGSWKLLRPVSHMIVFWIQLGFFVPFSFLKQVLDLKRFVRANVSFGSEIWFYKSHLGFKKSKLKSLAAKIFRYRLTIIPKLLDIS